jgi:hypothetical protein
VRVWHGHREMWFPEKRKPHPLPFRFDQRARPPPRRHRHVLRPDAGWSADFQAAAAGHTCVFTCPHGAPTLPFDNPATVIILLSSPVPSGRVHRLFVSVSAIRVRFTSIPWPLPVRQHYRLRSTRYPFAVELFFGSSFELFWLLTSAHEFSCVS